MAISFTGDFTNAKTQKKIFDQAKRYLVALRFSQLNGNQCASHTFGMMECPSPFHSYFEQVFLYFYNWVCVCRSHQCMCRFNNRKKQNKKKIKERE